MHIVFVHSMPGIFCFTNWVMSDIVLKARHFVALIPLGVAYVIHNYIEAMERGIGIYPFLDWHKDFSGCIKNCFIIPSIIWTIYAIQAKFTQAVKRHRDAARR